MRRKRHEVHMTRDTAILWAALVTPDRESVGLKMARNTEWPDHAHHLLRFLEGKKADNEDEGPIFITASVVHRNGVFKKYGLM